MNYQLEYRYKTWPEPRDEPSPVWLVQVEGRRRDLYAGVWGAWTPWVSLDLADVRFIERALAENYAERCAAAHRAKVDAAEMPYQAEWVYL